MKHVFGIRRAGEAGLLLRGHNGRAIRQHLTGHHNHMRRGHCGGAIIPQSVVSNVMSAPSKISNVVKKAGRTYIPLKFRI
jgi:hypothetical protein